MRRLEGKHALITGGARGIGAATALALLSEGARVIIADILDAEGEELVRTTGPAMDYLHLDVRDESQWIRTISTMRARAFGLDVLVNNAGVVRFGDPESIDMADYELILDVSTRGTILGCKHALPWMKCSARGSIINMSSIASIQGEPYCVAYSAAKGAVEAYTRAVAVYCAQNKLSIRCNSIHPAAIDTPMVRSAPQLAEAAGMMHLLENTGGSMANPLGEPADIANLIVFLASDESKFISGQKFVVDNTSSVTAGTVPGSSDTVAALR